MKVLLFGGTGMVGQGVLRECLLAGDVEQVRTVGRTATGVAHPKLDEIVHADLYDYAGIAAELTGFDACFFCLGVSSVGMGEADYTRVTFDLTLAAGRALAALNPGMVFVYVTGASTDSSGEGKVMWARVKGRTENALLALPLAAYMFRPGIIQPLHGARAKVRWIRSIYALATPVFSLARRLAPDRVLTTEVIGRAMLEVARRRPALHVLESPDIHAVSTGG